MSGSHSPGYAAKVMFSNVTETGATLETSDAGFLKYLKANGDCYVAFVTPLVDDSDSAVKPESQQGG
jgi:hypothetical protein